MNIQTIYTKNLRWIDVINPGLEEIEWLRQHFRFHDLHFQALAAHQHRPHIDHGPDYDFMVLLFPVYDSKTGEIVAGEVDFFIGPGFVITSHYDQIHTHKALFNATRTSLESRSSHMQKGSGFLLYVVLEKLFRRSYPILDHMNDDMDKIENGIFHKINLDMLSRIMLMKKNIIEFRKMMKTHRYVLEKLPKRAVPHLSFTQSKLYYKELQEYSENIWDILEALKETADTLADTNQSLTSHRLNEITKVISIFSAMLLPATLVAFIFGIGVEEPPFRYHERGFWIVIALMVFSSALMLAIFKHKKWF